MTEPGESGVSPTLIPDGLDAILVLVRHGETEYIVEGRFQGQAETPLTALGRRQAGLAGERLANASRTSTLSLPARPPAAIVHSPLLRTTETAQAIEAAFDAAGMHVERRPDDGLREIGQGVWEGLLHTEISARYAESLAGWRRRPLEFWPEGGESLREVEARARPMLSALLAELAAGRPVAAFDRSLVAGYRGDVEADTPWTILVGHDGVFKIVLLTLLGLPLERFWIFPFPLAGITVVEIRHGRAILRAHGLVEHLAALAAEESAAEATATERERAGAL